MEKRVFISYSSADKLISDAICHHLEEEGIPCWIAPRDIGRPDWAGDIMQALHTANVFVVVISGKSIMSSEVLKEVTEATKCCQYILPFKVDEEMLTDTFQYHLGPYHWLDAVTPPLEARIHELVDRIKYLSKEDAMYFNQKRWKLREKNVFPHGLFLGREQEIEETSRLLEEDHILFLHGMGGIGKSEIAKGYAKAFRDRYDCIIFATYISGLQDLLCGDDIYIENVTRADGESTQDWYARKLRALQTIVNEKTLLIIDNFDTDYDPKLSDFVNLDCCLLFTTRNNQSDYSTLHIGRIPDTAVLREIFLKHYGRSLKKEEEPVLEEILKTVAYHTITVELIAKQMRASFIKPAEMLERLQSSGGINTGLKEKVKRKGDSVSRSAFEYIRTLFSLSGLQEEDEHLLKCMCLVPVSGIKVFVLGEILDLEDFDSVNRLLDTSWLSLDEEEDILRIHPVIADVIREELGPDPVKCQDYIRGLYNRARRMWNMEIEERNLYVPLVKSILQRFPQPTAELFYEYVQFADCAWIWGDFELSQQAARQAYDFAVSEFGDKSKEAGAAAMTSAASYYNAGDPASADPWYEIGKDCYLETLPPNDRLTAVAYTKLARGARLRGDFAEAEKYLDACGRIFQSIIDEGRFPEYRNYPPSYSGVLMEISNLYLDKEMYEEALSSAEKTLAVMEADLDDEIANTTFVYQQLAKACSMLQDYEKADEYLSLAYERNMAMNGPASQSTTLTRELMADIQARRGNRENALRLYTLLELDLEKYFGAENPITKRIKDKKQEAQSSIICQ